MKHPASPNAVRACKKLLQGVAEREINASLVAATVQGIAETRASDEGKEGVQSFLAACRTWSVDSENRPQRGQFLPDLQPHSPAMGQKDGKKWTAAADLQPTISKSDRLLGKRKPSWLPA